MSLQAGRGAPPHAAPSVKRLLVATIALLALALAGIALVVAASTGLPRVDDLAARAPRRTALMLAREAEARRHGHRYRVDQRWVPYERVSPLLRRAVLIAEDDAFFSHGGLDWDEIKAAARQNLREGRVVRGGSTITQQLAKNLYLGEERTLLRKLKEVLLAVRIERALGKRRIFELYLNLIEWGDGVYGIEAAARRYFGVSAAELDARQAALLAAVIVNPRRYSPERPTSRIARRVRMILTRMYRRGLIAEADYRAALGEKPAPPGPLEWLFGPPTDTAPVEATPPDSSAPEPGPPAPPDSLTPPK